MKTEIRSLNECLSLTIDRRGVTPKKLGSDWVSTGYPVLSANNVKSTGLQKIEDIRYVDEKTYHKWMREEIQRGDILLTSEAPAGEVYVWDSDDKIVVGQRLYALRVKDDINPWFLAYYLQSSKGQAEIANKCSGSTVFGISAKTFDHIEVVLPDRSIQDKVVEVLLNIDKKIKTNETLSSKLESIVRLFYNYWFVQFDFPDKNGRPYKSSGGKLVWNNELKQKIPEDWETERLGDLVEFKTDKVEPGNTKGLPYTPMDMLPIKKMTFSNFRSDEEANSSLLSYQKNDILFGAMRPYFHRVCLAPFNGITRTTTFVLRASSDILGYAFETVDMDRTIAYATAHSVGTQQPYAIWENGLADMLIAKPPIALKNDFSKRISVFIEMQYKLSIENNKLSSLRDFLLPLLINGQVTFK